MNMRIKSVLYFFIFLGSAVHASAFLDVAQVQVNKIANKKQVSHKSPLEFKQAVVRYIKNTDHACFQNTQRNVDENVAYKKELRYLFKNYGTFSAITLLSRLRSAHQTMVKSDTNIEDESYQRYEQICSALLLTCAQVFFNEMRGQILSALHDVDNLISYWRYQQNHQMRYFFSKSPVKWIVGKEQEKEIIHNIAKLERKQKELYTLLGSLTGHAHEFAEVEITYEDCYAWIEQLCTIAHCIKITSQYSTDGSRFDEIAAELELKLKRISKFKSDCLASIASAKLPNRFVRNWVLYSTLLAAGAYMAHYNATNPEVVSKNLEKIKVGVAGAIAGMIIDPMTDLWKVFFDTNPESSVSSIEKRVINIEKYAGYIEARVNELTAPEIEALRDYALRLGKQVLTRMEEAKFTVNKEGIINDLMQDDLRSLSELIENTSIYYYDEKVDLGIVNILLMIDEVLRLLQKYPEVIDIGILPLVQEVGFFFGDVGDLIVGISKDHYWTARLSAFAPLAAICFGLHKMYQWSTTRDYSAIRIALADVNALLIESANHLDDHDYGKLVYLICKLRHKAAYLKNSLTDEFLHDVTKLESKQYSAQTKHGIVENMFNKYAFLGKIAK